MREDRMEDRDCNCNFHFLFDDRWVLCSLPFGETNGIMKLSYWKEKYYVYASVKKSLGRFFIIEKKGLTATEISPSVDGLFYNYWWNIIESAVQITMPYEGKATDGKIYIEELGNGVYVLLFNLCILGTSSVVLYLKEPPRRRMLIIYPVQHDLESSYLHVSDKEFFSKLIIKKEKRKCLFDVPTQLIYWYDAYPKKINEGVAVDGGSLYLANRSTELDILYGCALYKLVPGAKIILDKKLILPRIKTSESQILLSPCITEFVVDPRFCANLYFAFSNIPRYENFWVSAMK